MHNASLDQLRALYQVSRSKKSARSSNASRANVVYFDDAEAEMQRLRDYDTQRRAAGSQLGLDYNPSTDRYAVPTEEQGARLFALVHDLQGYQKNYPWMRPLLQYAMNKTGIVHDSETARIAADIGAKVEADSGFGFGSPGKSIKAAFAAANIAYSGQGALYGGTYDWGSQLVDPTNPNWRLSKRYGMGADGQDLLSLESPTGMTTSLNPKDGQLTNDDRALLAAHGFDLTDTGDAAQAREAAKATVDRLAPAAAAGTLEGPDLTLYQQSNRLTTVTDQEFKELQQGFYNPVVPVARTGFMVLDAPLQEVQGRSATRTPPARREPRLVPVAIRSRRRRQPVGVRSAGRRRHRAVRQPGRHDAPGVAEAPARARQHRRSRGHRRSVGGRHGVRARHARLQRAVGRHRRRGGDQGRPGEHGAGEVR
jgi:hypothetical protein